MARPTLDLDERDAPTMPQDEFAATLDAVTRAFLDRDVERLVALYDLPCEMTTVSGRAYVLGDETALRIDLASYVTALGIHRVTDIVREISGVERPDDDTLRGTYRTHILSDALRVADPYASTMTLRRRDGTWRVARIDNALGHRNWTTGAPRGRPTGA
jgi:hypothetical protein